MKNNTKRENTTKYLKLNELIKEHNTIIIHRHQGPDADAYGSQMGLKHIIKNSYPDKNVYAVGADHSDFYYLGITDKIDDSKYEDALVIVCDTANRERIEDSRYKKGKTIVKIDHHPNDDAYGNLVIVDLNVSSTSELIIDICENNEKLSLTNDAAKVLYAGILGDTGRFLYSIYPNTHIYAAKLLTYTFDIDEVHLMTTSETLNRVKLNGHIQNNIKYNNGVAYFVVDKKLCQKYDVPNTEVSVLVNSLGMVREAKIWALFIEDDTFIRVNLRSRGNVVINEVAKKYKGGGHPKASGAIIKSFDEIDDILKDLKKLTLECE